MDLTLKQKCFVDEYLIDLNATQAAIRAGYSAKTAQEQSSRLLSNVMVQNAIAEHMSAREQRTEITQDKVLADIDAIKCDAMRLLPNKDGNLVMQNHGAALKASELLGKHVGMFGDKLQITGANGGAIATRTESPEEKAARIQTEIGDV